MKTFLGAKNKVIDQDAALALAGVNLFVTPGVGTILAGGIFPGLAQLGFAAAGFVLLLKWFWALFQFLLQGGTTGPAWEWKVGLLLFGIGWVGALWSSVSLLRAAPKVAPPPLPPSLNGSAN